MAFHHAVLGADDNLAAAVERPHELTRSSDHTYYSDITRFMAGLTTGPPTTAQWLNGKDATRARRRVLVTDRRELLRTGAQPRDELPRARVTRRTGSPGRQPRAPGAGRRSTRTGHRRHRRSASARRCPGGGAVEVERLGDPDQLGGLQRDGGQEAGRRTAGDVLLAGEVLPAPAHPFTAAYAAR